MRIRSRTEKKKARIEIVPMIDTMMFLLVFFMLATLSMTVMRGMPVNLPQAQTSKSDVEAHKTVTLSLDGRLYYDRQEIQRGELHGLLERDLATQPELLITLNADEEVTHGKVVELVDDITLAGVTRLAIATKPKQN
jgi:biopolymer transport protein ExbD